jgi:hypothetical protein
MTSNLPFDEWTSVFGSERLTGALLDRLTHHVHILEMNGESYRLRKSQQRRKAARVSSLALVRFDRNDYSVPTAYGHRPVLVRGYVEEVVIACGAEIIARHPRSYGREDFLFEPRHYLALLEQKIGALDQAAPLQGWDLPEAFATLRRLLEARMGRSGKREYIQVLRLLETFRLEDVHAAVREALRLGAIGFDAVKHLVLCRIERRPPKLDLKLYPYLPRVAVATTSARAYMALLGEAAP